MCGCSRIARSICGFEPGTYAPMLIRSRACWYANSASRTTREGWLADGQPDLTLRHGEAGDRIHHERHFLAATAKPFGDRSRNPGPLQALQRRLIRRRDHHDGTRHTFRAQVALDELLHFAT